MSEEKEVITISTLSNDQKLYTENVVNDMQLKIKRLQEKNEELKDRNANLRLNLATYDLPEIKKVLTDWRTGELDKKFKNLQKENEEQKEQIKQLEDFVKSDGEICHINHEYTYKLQKVLQEVKSIAKGVRGYLEVPAPRDVRFEMDRILDLITEAELPGQKENEEE